MVLPSGISKYNERKTIYASNKQVWDRVVQCAKEGGISVSQLLLSPFEKSSLIQVGLGQINRIELKLDELFGSWIESREVDLPKPRARDSKSAADSESDNRTEAEILADGQAKLEANRKEHEKGPVKVAKIKEVRGKVRSDKEVGGQIKSLTGYSGARPKGTK